MAKIIERRRQKSGQPPGTLIHTGEEHRQNVRVTVIDYNDAEYSEKVLAEGEDFGAFTETPTVTWINVDGVHDKALIERIGGCFDLHPLVMEDIMSTSQRPKVEDMGDYLYIVVRMLYRKDAMEEIVSEQVSLILGPSFVVSFQEQEGDVFGSVRNRIKSKHGIIRKMHADYLAYALIDAVVDNYFNILEEFGERAEDLEDSVIGDANSDALRTIHSLKNEMVLVRKSVAPLREAVNSLARGSRLISKNTTLYFRDVYDHAIRVVDSVESLRDLVNSIRDTYLTSISNRMNEVMKVLTIIATIFIPLTFIAGVYGMNFKHMPELEWRWAYPAVWMLMLTVAGLMVVFFKRKNWL